MTKLDNEESVVQSDKEVINGKQQTNTTGTNDRPRQDASTERLYGTGYSGQHEILRSFTRRSEDGSPYGILEPSAKFKAEPQQFKLDFNSAEEMASAVAKGELNQATILKILDFMIYVILIS